MALRGSFQTRGLASDCVVRDCRKEQRPKMFISTFQQPREHFLLYLIHATGLANFLSPHRIEVVYWDSQQEDAAHDPGKDTASPSIAVFLDHRS